MIPAGGLIYQVLLGDEALDVALGEGLLEGLGEGGVLGVSVHGHHPLAGLSQLGQRNAVRTPGRKLRTGGRQEEILREKNNN